MTNYACLSGIQQIQSKWNEFRRKQAVQQHRHLTSSGNIEGPENEGLALMFLGNMRGFKTTIVYENICRKCLPSVI